VGTRKVLESPLGKPRAPLSHAVAVGNLVFVSGTAPFRPGSTEMAPDFEGQMHQVMRNLEAILEAAGTRLGKIVKANVILADMGDFPKMNAIYRSYFDDGDYPARTTIQAVLPLPGMMLEIECVAERELA
jgi:2-iminobutanoate/2-iminopropanoate deaminase